jgi:hypothetical protein
VRRKPADQQNGKISNHQERDITPTSEQIWRKIESDESKRPNEKKIKENAEQGKENLDSFDVVSSLFTPPRFQAFQKQKVVVSANTEYHQKIKSKDDPRTALEVRKYLNFSNNTKESCEADLEEIITQAPNPTTISSPSKNLRVNIDPNFEQDKPNFNKETNGYLASKIPKNEGK